MKHILMLIMSLGFCEQSMSTPDGLAYQAIEPTAYRAAEQGMQQRLINWLHYNYTTLATAEEKEVLLSRFVVSMYTYYDSIWAAAYNGTANGGREHEKLRNMLTLDCCIATKPAHAAILGQAIHPIFRATFAVVPSEELFFYINDSKQYHQFYDKAHDLAKASAVAAMKNAPFWSKGEIGYAAAEETARKYYYKHLEPFLDNFITLPYEELDGDEHIFQQFTRFTKWSNALMENPLAAPFMEPWMNAIATVLN